MNHCLLLLTATLLCLNHGQSQGFKCPFHTSRYQDSLNPLSSNVVHHLTSRSSSRILDCPVSRYRVIDGSCNNVQNPKWGKAGEPFERWLKPDYGDSKSKPRVAKSGRPLPNARLVSREVFVTEERRQLGLSNFFTSFAQFLNHDLQNTDFPPFRGCCTDQQNTDPECTPVAVSTDDPFYSKHNVTCLPFRRATPVFVNGVRNQINLATSFIDGGPIYGRTESMMVQLRSFVGGKLKTSRIAGHDDLLKDEERSNTCFIPKEDPIKKCFKAGDPRLNQQIGLTIVHSLWLKEHNRIATILGQLNPNWSDETLFQESRKIVGAQLQHITFNEFLPTLLGLRLFLASGLSSQTVGYSNVYDPQINPSSSSVFSTAAFRLHSYIFGFVGLINDFEMVTQLPLSETFLNPSLLYERNGQRDLLRGFLRQNAGKVGPTVTDQIHEQLFRPPGANFGADLIMTDIERNRDHGIPGYNAWRSLCGLPKVKDFKDLERYLDLRVAKVVAKLYENVDDIDLYIGGMAEKPAFGAHIGSTLICIIIEQFKRLKKGDRLWYENDCKTTGGNACFNPDQLEEIRKSSLAKVICDNSDIELIQRRPLRTFGVTNPALPCIWLPPLDLTKWKS